MTSSELRQEIEKLLDEASGYGSDLGDSIELWVSESKLYDGLIALITREREEAVREAFAKLEELFKEAHPDHPFAKKLKQAMNVVLPPTQ